MLDHGGDATDASFELETAWIEVSRNFSSLMPTLPNCTADALVLRPSKTWCRLHLNEPQRRRHHVGRIFIRLRAAAISLPPLPSHPSNLAYTQFCFFLLLPRQFNTPIGNVLGGSAPQIPDSLHPNLFSSSSYTPNLYSSTAVSPADLHLIFQIFATHRSSLLASRSIMSRSH